MTASAVRAALAATFFTVAGLAALPAVAQTMPSAVAPFTAKSQARETLKREPGTVPAAVLRLAPVDPSAIAAVRRANAASHTKRLQIGVGRPAGQHAASRAQALDWRAVSGGMVAHWQVVSPGAEALRVSIDVAELPAGTELRFAGDGLTGTVYGPVTGRELAAAAAYWSPVLEGESATVEVFVPSDTVPSSLSLAIGQVSHLFVSPRHPKAESLAKAGSQFCEVDLVCRAASDAALASAGRSVARMTFGDGMGGGSQFLCTGTLLNSAGNTFTPYFYSAAHCIDTQAAASTLATHWFYETTGCGNETLSASYVQVTGGAALLYANEDSDALLLRLNNPPPAGAVFAGWDATTIGFGTAVTAVHHPSGDYKKVSLGSVAGFESALGLAAGSFIKVNWNSTTTGVTEGGSSGSAIFTAVGNPASEYRLRGGLLGGPASCTASPSELHDYYSRFDQVYPAIAQYLNPASGGTNYTALWWNAAESGWGINLNHQGDIIFATLFTYDSAGRPMWLVMSNGERQSGSETFAGILYRTTGPAFNANPFTPIGPGNLTAVGAMAVSFSGPNAGALSYSVDGVTVTKSITKQVYGTRAAVCSATTGSRASASNYQDLWWNASESGWGVNVTHQDQTLFATLFTYGFDGQVLWLVMSEGARQSDGSYFGDLYRTAGPPFNAEPFTPIGPGNLTWVGTMRFRFFSGTNGTLEYTVDGVSVTKSITRQEFGSPKPLCVS